MEHNGWTNYETWRVNLEMIDNNKDMALWDAEEIEDWAYEYIEEESTGLAKDFSMAFLKEVNWFEISNHLRDTYGICRNCNEETEEEYCKECKEEQEAMLSFDRG